MILGRPTGGLVLCVIGGGSLLTLFVGSATVLRGGLILAKPYLPVTADFKRYFLLFSVYSSRNKRPSKYERTVLEYFRLRDVRY